MFGKLMPKEGKYFDHFNKQGHVIEQLHPALHCSISGAIIPDFVTLSYTCRAG